MPSPTSGGSSNSTMCRTPASHGGTLAATPLAPVKDDVCAGPEDLLRGVPDQPSACRGPRPVLRMVVRQPVEPKHPLVKRVADCTVFGRQPAGQRALPRSRQPDEEVHRRRLVRRSGRGHVGERMVGQPGDRFAGSEERVPDPIRFELRRRDRYGEPTSVVVLATGAGQPPANARSPHGRRRCGPSVRPTSWPRTPIDDTL